MIGDSFSARNRSIARSICWTSLLVALSAPWWFERPWLLRPFAVPMVVWVAWTQTVSRSVLVGTLTVAFGTLRRTPWTADARDQTMVEFMMLSVIALLAFVIRSQWVARRNAERTDSLTGIANREACLERLAMELDRAKRQGLPIAVSFWDCDDFKQLNDEHGHLMGDRTLKAIGEIIGSNVRPYDIWARWGGDEFVLVLPNTTSETAAAIIDRLQATFAATMAHAPLSVSLSVGSVAFGPAADQFPATANEAIAAADSKMYEAKRSTASS